VTCPKLFFHSRNDDIVPFRFGKRLFEIAPEPKTFVEVEGDHNVGVVGSGSAFMRGFREFVQSLE